MPEIKQQVNRIGVSASKAVPSTISARLFESAAKHADLSAIAMSGDDYPLTYSQLAERVRDFASALGGITPLEPVGILSENRPEWGIAYFGILAAGGIVVPFDCLLKDAELHRFISESRIKKLFISPKHRERLEAITDRQPLELLPLDKIGENSGIEFTPNTAIDSNSPAVIIFTSGTTGNSKRVILTHHNILSDVDGVSRRLNFMPGERFLSVLPLHHTFEATCGMILPLLNGLGIYYVAELNSKEILDGFKKHRITHFISVPLLFEKLYHGVMNAVRKAPWHKRALFRLMLALTKIVQSVTGWKAGRIIFSPFRRKAGLDSLRLMVSGGAPLPAEVSRSFNLLGFDFVEGYGMTESSPVLTVNPAGRGKHGSVGPPLDNVEIRIENPDEHGVGEVIARGPMVMQGYQDNPEETAKIIKEGWLHTGDLGRLDGDGYLYIVGRKKNLIISAAGKNIYPEEIEAALLESPLILEAMIYGKKDDRGREEVAALIYPDFEALGNSLNMPPQAISDSDIKTALDIEIKNISEQMADYKRIKHITYRRQELEKSSTRKIKRHLHH